MGVVPKELIHLPDLLNGNKHIPRVAAKEKGPG
jgi:hypothetical protein